jgi:membrane protein implicated in regulation of membrane protease activity
MTDILSLWWVWLSAALVFGLIEILAPGFLFLGFALGALVMSAITAFSLVGLSLSAKLAVFAVLSLICWLALRRAFRPPTGTVETFDHDVND